MPDNSLPLFRDGITTLKSLRKSLKAQRRALVQIVADTEIEMCEVHTSFALKQLEMARDLYAKLVHDASPTQDAAPVTLTTDWRGRNIPQE